MHLVCGALPKLRGARGDGLGLICSKAVMQARNFPIITCHLPECLHSAEGYTKKRESLCEGLRDVEEKNMRPLGPLVAWQ